MQPYNYLILSKMNGWRFSHEKTNFGPKERYEVFAQKTNCGHIEWSSGARKIPIELNVQERWLDSKSLAWTSYVGSSKSRQTFVCSLLLDEVGRVKMHCKSPPQQQPLTHNRCFPSGSQLRNPCINGAYFAVPRETPFPWVPLFH